MPPPETYNRNINMETGKHKKLMNKRIIIRSIPFYIHFVVLSCRHPNARTNYFCSPLIYFILCFWVHIQATCPTSPHPHIPTSRWHDQISGCGSGEHNSIYPASFFPWNVSFRCVWIEPVSIHLNCLTTTTTTPVLYSIFLSIYEVTSLKNFWRLKRFESPTEP